MHLGLMLFVVLLSCVSLNCIPVETDPATNMTLMNQSVLEASDILFSGISMNMSIPVGGMTRDQVTEPVSYEDDVNDEVIFEDAKDPSKKLYLPRYRIAVEAASGQQRYKVSLEKGIHGWSLVIHLAKYPAPRIEDAVRDADEINHKVTVLLRYKGAKAPILGTSDEGGVQEKSFQEVIPEGHGIKAVLNLSNLEERDDVYRAMTEPSYESSLVIGRMVSLEVPTLVSYGSSVLRTSGMSGMTFLSLDRGIQIFRDNSNSMDTTEQYDLMWRVIGGIAGNPVPNCPTCPPGPDQTWLLMQPIAGVELSNLGAVDYESLDLGKLENLNYIADGIRGKPGADNQLPPGDVFAVRTSGGNYAKAQVLDYGENIAIKWETYPKIPHFGSEDYSLDEFVKPFIFDKDLHPYIFQDINPPSLGPQSLIQTIVNGHSYYQSSSRRQVFYYLPDSFKLARYIRSPHKPEMSIRFKSADQVELSYVAMPYVNPIRLKEDSSELKQFESSGASNSVEEPVLEPLTIDPGKIRLEIALPSSNASNDLYQVRKGVSVSLVDGYSDGLKMDMHDFQDIFDSLFGGSGDLLFQGKILVEVYPGSTESIPFIGRMNDLTGPIFDYQEKQESASSSIYVNLTNAIESPVLVRSWEAEIQQGGSATKARVIGPGLPVQLGPGEWLNLTLNPFEALTGNGPVHATFGTGEMDVIPDKNAIWNSTVDKNVPTVPAKIAVKTFMFRDPEISKDTLEVIVLFRDGSFAELTPQNSTAEITLQTSLKDRILHNPNLGAYSYTVKTIHSNGTITQSQERTDTSRLLIV